ncbi:MAG TPA: hypothetical protein ENF38_00370 [Candidatus Aenigmarchaeota archaeon]|nr:hypothetical protein [Candidatus Aenigmarchaeota archaeon]
MLSLEEEILRRKILNKILSSDAKERLGRVKLVRPELAIQVENYLVQLYQAGRIKNLITDEQIKEILKMVGRNKDFRIVRR